jgi:hypothetical protein
MIVVVIMGIVVGRKMVERIMIIGNDPMGNMNPPLNTDKDVMIAMIERRRRMNLVHIRIGMVVRIAVVKVGEESK